LYRIPSGILLVLLLSSSMIFIGAAQVRDLNGSKEMMAEVNPGGNSMQFETITVQTRLRLFALYNDYWHNLMLVANLTDIDGNPVAGEAISFGLRRKPAPITEPWFELGTATTNAAGVAKFSIAFSGFTGPYSVRARHEQHMDFSASENIVNIVFPSGQVIHIKSDGSIDPLNAPIQKNGYSYVLTDDITADSAGIAIERDNIVLDGAGHLIQPFPHIVGQYGISLIDKTNVTIKNVRIRSFFFHIELSNSVNNTIAKSMLIGSEYPTLVLGQVATVELGLYLCGSTNNSISENEVTNTYAGISLESSPNNKIYHNNLINNTEHAYIELSGYTNMWDDGYPSGGNYWSDHAGIDVKSGPDQDLPGSDGIGDMPYIIDSDNQDQYPLMKPWSLMPTIYAFPIVWEEETFIVSVESNSTISNFYFNQPMREIEFNVTGEVGTIGFYNVTIPKQLLDGPWAVLIDAQPALYFTPVENETHSFLYFAYPHSTHEVRIIGTYVIGPPPDTTPPLIGTPFQEPDPNNVIPDQSATVYVDVTDTESSVKNVILSYKTDGSITWTNLTMLYNATLGLYEAAIPESPSGTTICYKIIAYDNADNVAVNDNAGQYYSYTVNPPPLSASITPLSASINIGESLTFTSTVSGGYTPYNYQWYLNGAPVSGETSSSWPFTPTTSGIHYVHLKITDAKGNTTQSETAHITVAAVPVGGYSIPIKVHTKAEPIIPYIALITILAAILVKIKRKAKRKR
jgi:parallel beta-helix repeat protein